MAFCSHCGTRLPDGANFCHSCGSRVSPESQRTKNQTFIVDKFPRIVINNRASGSIEIGSSSQHNEINVDFRLKNEEYIEWNASQSGNLITIDCRLKSGVLEFPGGFSLQGSRAEVMLKVPKQVTLDISTRFGEIFVAGVDGTTLSATSSAGSIDVRGFSGTCNVGTKSGRISLERVDGKINARNLAGSINFSGSIGSGESVLSTKVGNIEATLLGDLNLRIDALSRVGHVTLDPKIRGQQFQSEQYTIGNRITSTIGIGMGSLYLETTTGNISIHQGEK